VNKTTVMYDNTCIFVIIFLLFRECDKMKSLKYHLLPWIAHKQFPSLEMLRKSRETWKKHILDDSAQATPRSIVSKDSGSTFLLLLLLFHVSFSFFF
jgi:hypothetical protein